MRAELIAVGTELTLGTTVDTNSAWIARTLAQVGVKVERITLVDDQRERIAEAVRSAWEAAELVICTGGLGRESNGRTIGPPGSLTRQRLPASRVPWPDEPAVQHQTRASCDEWPAERASRWW